MLFDKLQLWAMLVDMNKFHKQHNMSSISFLIFYWWTLDIPKTMYGDNNSNICIYTFLFFIFIMNWFHKPYFFINIFGQNVFYFLSWSWLLNNKNNFYHLPFQKLLLIEGSTKWWNIDIHYLQCYQCILITNGCLKNSEIYYAI